MRIKEINLEEGMPTSDEAMTYLKRAIPQAKSSGYKCMIIIHGYGSSGKGGVIRTKARQWLAAQVRNGKLKAAIPGEEFTIFNFTALNLKNKFPELDPYLRVTNHGVTILEL